MSEKRRCETCGALRNMSPDALYKRFLKGEVYPEIKVRHEAADGRTTNARLRDSTKFFKVDQ